MDARDNTQLDGKHFGGSEVCLFGAWIDEADGVDAHGRPKNKTRPLPHQQRIERGEIVKAAKMECGCTIKKRREFKEYVEDLNFEEWKAEKTIKLPISKDKAERIMMRKEGLEKVYQPPIKMFKGDVSQLLPEEE